MTTPTDARCHEGPGPRRRAGPSRSLGTALVYVMLVNLLPGAAAAQEAPTAPESLALRLGLQLGGAWTDNVYINASSAAGLVGLGRLELDADWLVSDAAILELSYQGDLEGNRGLDEYDLRGEDHTGHLVHATFGLRPSDTLYLSLRGGSEVAYFRAPTGSNGSPYTFWGVFGRAGLRVEAGQTQTVEAGYTFRADQFPDYDLDNQGHTGELAWEIALGDSTELRVPIAFEHTRYGERFLQDADGQPTDERRTANRWLLEPRLTLLPSFDVTISAALRGEYNASDDTYASPYDATDPAARPELVAHYESFMAVAGMVALRWAAAESLTVDVKLAAGNRRYDSRPAMQLDPQGEPVDTGDLERDTWVQPAVSLRWRFADPLALEAAYTLLQQWSNDYLWDFGAHRVTLALATWWES